MKNPLKRIIIKIGNEDPLLLAHHPTCEYYSHHVIEIYGQKLCMGCFVVYPVGFLSLISLLSLRLSIFSAEMAAIPTVFLYIIGFVLVLPKVVMKIYPGQRTKTARILTKTTLATGLAFIMFPFFFRPSERVVTIILISGFLIPYVGYKMLTALDDCKGCPEAENFPNCSGMSFDDTYSYSGEDSDIHDQK